MFRKSGQRGRESIDEGLSKSTRGPRFQRAQVQFEADDGKTRVQRRAHINGSIDYAHGALLRRADAALLFFGLNQPAGSRQSRMQVECRTGHQNVQPQP